MHSFVCYLPVPPVMNTSRPLKNPGMVGFDSNIAKPVALSITNPKYEFSNFLRKSLLKPSNQSASKVLVFSQADVHSIFDMYSELTTLSIR